MGPETGRLLAAMDPFFSLLASLTSAPMAASLLLTVVDDDVVFVVEVALAFWAAAAAAVRTSVADLKEEPSILPKASSE